MKLNLQNGSESLKNKNNTKDQRNEVHKEEKEIFLINCFIDSAENSLSLIRYSFFVFFTVMLFAFFFFLLLSL